jgi:tyrosine-protein kinase Etk/Wzc
MTDSRDQTEEESPSPEGGERTTLVDFLYVLIRKRRVIGGVMIGFLIFSGLFVLVSSNEYESEARVIREVPDEAPSLGGGGLSALQGLGIGGLGGLGGSGLTADAYPVIAESREVRLAVVQDTFYFPSIDRRTTYVDFVEQSSSGLLSRLLREVDTLFGGGTEGRKPIRDASGELIYPTEEEEKAIKKIRSKVTTTVDQQTGIMSLAVRMGDPVLASSMVESFIEALQKRVRVLRTKKKRQNLQFVKQRFAEAKKELQQAEQRLAQFVDRNQDISTAGLRTERDRLERQVRFKSELYSSLQAQVTQARIQVQKSEPVTTVVEEPVPPIKASGPNPILIVVLSAFLGFFFGAGGVYLHHLLLSQSYSEERLEKIEEIKSILVPDRLRTWVGL